MDNEMCELCSEEVAYCECARCLGCGELYPQDEEWKISSDGEDEGFGCVKCI